ncbi:MAG TPA: GNAT family N-acetyltransferase [Pirellulales bacterium]|nr:GNAT family N-acetyltransferase [Pirellulales bacterium]
MPGQASTPLSFGVARPEELPETLQMLFNWLDETARPLQIAAAQEEIERTGGEGQLLFVAKRGSALVAAIWVQMLPGRVASLWPPGVASEEPAATATTLIDLAIAKAAGVGVRLVQALLDTDAGTPSEWLRKCGFKYTTDLLYLVSLSDKFPTSEPQSELVFEPLGKNLQTAVDSVRTVENGNVSADRMARLATIVQQTYVNTQDCPAIQGLRSVEDVLLTYKSVGIFNPARWFFVRQQNADMGCLLLADHPMHSNCELVYMGLIPEARGHRWGLEIVRYAQWQAGNFNYAEKTAGGKSAERMVLAVDATNSPAISMYAAAGFETWDRRSVFLREISAEN